MKLLRSKLRPRCGGQEPATPPQRVPMVAGMRPAATPALRNTARTDDRQRARPLQIEWFVRTEVTKRGSLSAWWSALWPSFRRVTVQGVRGRYLCSGRGPPLLVLASPLALARSYMRAMRSLCRWFTVVCVELPGCGGSARLARPWSPARYARWALELVRDLPLAAPIVLGHAGSVPIALELARLAPDEIGGVVIAETPGTARSFGPRALPEIVWNALRHRSTFARHMRNERAYRAHASPHATHACASSVPMLDARHVADDWKVIRRFVATVRRGAHGMPAGASASRALFAS